MTQTARILTSQVNDPDPSVWQLALVDLALLEGNLKPTANIFTEVCFYKGDLIQ